MKIRITKANGTQMELSNVAGVELVEANAITVTHMDPRQRLLYLNLSGFNNGMSVFDATIKWPLPVLVG